MLDIIDTDIVAAVRELYARDSNAKKFLDECAKKKRDARKTSVEQIMRDVGVSRPVAVALAKALEETGSGEFVLGRRGSESRFVWYFSRVSLGQIAAGETEELTDMLDPIDEDEDVEASGEVKNLTISQAKHYLAQSLGVSPDQIEIHIKA